MYRILILFLLQASLRALLWFELSIVPGSYDDFRGLIGDFALAMALASLTCLLPKRLWLLEKWLFISLATLLAACAVVNFEVVLATGSNVNFDHLMFVAQPAMLKGSIISLDNFGPLVFVLVVIGAAAWTEFKRPSARKLSKFAGPLAFAFSLLLLWNSVNKRFIVGTSYWRQYNFIVGNLHEVTMRLKPKLKVKRSSNATIHGTRPNGTDLNGSSLVEKPINATKVTRPNVLILLFESVSGARHPGEINQDIKFHRFKSFEKIAEQGLRVRNFIALNRQTNRGEFSIICGQFPNLSENAAKMDMYDSKRDGACLPSVLANDGYRTMYLQAAPLAFMNKMRFMPDAGFQKVHGAEVFKAGSFNSGWGANDRALLDMTKDKITELSKDQSSPWLLTVLTVGTHHPYETSPDFRSDYKPGSYEHSMAFLDAEFLKFIDWMQASSLLENTLVLVSADESAGMRHEALDRVAQNWLPLYAVGPGIPRQSINDSTFTTADVALSVMDYTNGEEAKNNANFSGRSFFRKYADEREIVYGNCFHRTVGLFESARSVVICNRDYEGCERLEWSDSLFWPYSSAKDQSIDKAKIRTMVDEVQWVPDL